jgi:hypothetical protein
MFTAKSSHLSTVQGNNENRSETYIWYVERESQLMTQQCAKNVSGMPGFAGQQADMVRGFA